MSGIQGLGGADLDDAVRAFDGVRLVVTGVSPVVPNGD